MLENAGHRVSIANNGREAVDAVRNEGFDVVLMDLQMPVLDGFGATRKIRDYEEPMGTRVRIVAITAAAMAGDREKCLAAGMDDYVSKPIKRAALLSVLTPGIHNDAGPKATEADSSISFFDYHLAELKVPGGERVQRDLVSLFLEECPRLLRDIDTGLQSDDVQTAKRAAHTLTSSCKTVLASTMAVEVGELEQLLIKGDCATAVSRLEQLNSTAQLTVASMKDWLS